MDIINPLHKDFYLASADAKIGSLPCFGQALEMCGKAMCQGAMWRISRVGMARGAVGLWMSAGRAISCRPLGAMAYNVKV